MQTFDNILFPIMWVVAWIMVRFHDLFVWLNIPSDSGLAWGGSIVGLVIVIRILLIPLFVKQIKASRGMQLLAPEMQKIQKKYKGKSDPASREAMTRETMELYRKHKTNPFASCLPILAQSPIFFGLFRVLFNLSNLANGEYHRDAIGPLNQELAAEANAATIFGAPISSFFLQEGATTQTRIVTVLLIIAMSGTTFLTQKQLTQKNMPAAALTGPMAQQQKMLLYLLPLIFMITGVNFPIGVLIYWTTTNIWSMGQQFYVIRRNPTPGSAAEKQLLERRRRKAAARGEILEEDKPKPVEEKPRGQRPQPKRKHRAKGAPGAPGTTPGQADADGGQTASGDAPDGEGPVAGGSHRAGGRTGKAPGDPTSGTPEVRRKRPAGSGTSSGSAKAAGSGRPAGAGKPSGSGKTGASGKPAPGARPGKRPGQPGQGNRPKGPGGGKPRPSGPDGPGTGPDTP